MKNLKFKYLKSSAIVLILHSSTAFAAMRGFPEFLPGEQMVLDAMKATISSAYSRYGYGPIETPAIERIATLEAKGIDGKEVYGLRRLNTVDAEDDGTTSYALRFDQTVPLARYVAEHKDSLAFPFRRQAIGKVWRGERASTGRFREFYQCDVDVIGRGKLSLLHDAEPPAIINEVFENMGIGRFVIRVNNRKILQGLFQTLGVEDPRLIKSAIKVVDNMEKESEADTQRALVEMGISPDKAAIIQSFFKSKMPGEELLDHLRSKGYNPLFMEGVEELRTVYRQILELRVNPSNIQIDLGIARGLDYYTGTVYETTLVDYPDLGSICSGGRYDNLAESYAEEKFPGVGISIGLTRLFSNLLERGIVKTKASGPAPILITCQNPSQLSAYQHIATTLRLAGINTEVYYEEDALGKQLRFANKRGIPFVIIANADEIAAGIVNLKDMLTGEQKQIPMAALVERMRAELR